MSLRILILLEEIHYRVSRAACRLFGRSPAFRHTGVGCRGRSDCAEKIRRVWR